MQNTEVAKAAKAGNPSYESFRPNQIHGVQYREMEDRPGLGQAQRIRRYPNGQLDFMHVADQVLDVIKKMNYNPDDLTPIEAALVTVVLPLKFRKMEPQQAELLTQMSTSEKEAVAALVEGKLAEILNWSAGNGGGSVPGRTLTDVGG